MTPEEACLLANTFLATIQKETRTTCRVLGAIPAGKGAYRPDPHSRTALELAWHIASADVWFLQGFLLEKFEMEDDTMPADISEASEIASWYEDSFATNFDTVSKLPPSLWAKPLDFFGIYNLPAAMYLQFMLLHSVHHRGQLCAYLRAMGGKVPNIYGGSYDEPMEGPPQG